MHISSADHSFEAADNEEECHSSAFLLSFIFIVKMFLARSAFSGVQRANFFGMTDALTMKQFSRNFRITMSPICMGRRAAKIATRKVWHIWRSGLFPNITGRM